MAGGFPYMDHLRVLIVEDDPLTAIEVEAALERAGHAVCGVAVSQGDAIVLARALKPDCAVVDVTLAPGDGRLVAKEIVGDGGVVLFATAQCEDVTSMSDTGASGCLPKPYEADDVPAALTAIYERRRGNVRAPVPDDMILLNGTAKQ